MTGVLQLIETPGFWVQPVVLALNGWAFSQLGLRWLAHRKFAWVAVLTHSLSEQWAQQTKLRQLLDAGVTPAFLQQNLDTVLNLFEREFQSPERIRQIYRYGEEVLPALIQQLVDGGLSRLEQSEQRQKMEAVLADKLTWIFENASLTYYQAEFAIDLLFSTLLTPTYIRQVLLEGLSDENIYRLERGVSNQVGGMKGFLLRLMGVREGLLKLRESLEADPEGAELQLTELIDRFEIREKLTEKISNFTFQRLSEDTQEAIVQYVAKNSLNWAAENKTELSGLVLNWSREASRLMVNRILHWNFRQWLDESRPEWRQSFAMLLHQRLQMLWTTEVGQRFIVEKVSLALEQLLQQSTSLQARISAWVGMWVNRFSLVMAVLGFWLGLLANWIQAMGWGVPALP